MAATHKNKTFATLLASVLGALGAHRFYLYGKTDRWAWLHFLSIPFPLAAIVMGSPRPFMFLASPFVFSVLAGFLEALVIGLTPDEKWDVRHNADSGRRSASSWPLALLLVLTFGIGATAAIASIARAFDLLFTGGAYG